MILFLEFGFAVSYRIVWTIQSREEGIYVIVYV